MAAPQTPEARVCICAILGAYGVRGEVRVKCFTVRSGDIGAFGPVETEDGGRRFTLKVTRSVRGAVAASLSGITDRAMAEALRGVRLYVPRSALPEIAGEGEFYHADLLGMSVYWLDGPRQAGEIVGVNNYGAGDVIEVALAAEPGQKQRTVVLPFTLEVAPEVNLPERFVRVNPPPELMSWTDIKQ